MGQGEIDPSREAAGLDADRLAEQSDRLFEVADAALGLAEVDAGRGAGNRLKVLVALGDFLEGLFAPTLEEVNGGLADEAPASRLALERGTKIG